MSGVFIVKANTAVALGLQNLWRVFWHRTSVVVGLNPVRRLSATLPTGPFFRTASLPTSSLPASSRWWDKVAYFGHSSVAVSKLPPDWHADPMSGRRVLNSDRPWWQIPDFDLETGDIKAVWEASRFDWLLAFAEQARNGRTEALDRLNEWLADWCRRNPAYTGPNWMCGQEASIRVMHMAMAARLMGQHLEPEPALLDLVDAHLKRIAPTLSYAVAQDNNHGTSEAAALFIGGSWLAHCRPTSRGKSWAHTGRCWLENRVGRLVEADGSFSQYSMNYHRVMLDTLCMAEIWRRDLALSLFSPRYLSHAKAAADWLRLMVRPGGDGPNTGANDGARLLPLTDSDYRDYRSSVQLGMVMFAGCRAYEADGQWNAPLRWLGIELPEAVAPAPDSKCLDQGGYACLYQGRAFALVRYPRFRFRPGQADALHLDFWLGDDNVLRDGGTFSYNTEPRWLTYFPGTASHNTVQFDDRDQMPRLSRFLFGDWLTTKGQPDFRSTSEGDVFAAGYRDGWGAEHHRSVSLSSASLVIDDAISCFQRRAVLRWRLIPGEWVLSGNVISNGRVSLAIATTAAVVRMEIVEGWESRYYLKRTQLPVLEVELASPGNIKTTIEWTA